MLNKKIKLYSEFEREAIPYMDPLYNFALRMTGNKNDAGNLLKETFKKAFWFFEKLERGTNYKMWLFRVMKYAYLNSYRKKSKELIISDYEEIEKFYENMKYSSIDGLQLEKELYDKLSDDDISDALSSLPEDFRIIIILCDIERFSYNDIADFVDVPIGVVRSRLHRGRKMLLTNLYKCAEKKGYISK
ncbi:MAG: RNA polymerase subunit sigma [Ignavibacteria bacterium RBG_16_34_14]|nr:MAG: RNA polymerase subunit sigma [Ignavibacteria bacterium RBG_16_34_14]